MEWRRVVQKFAMSMGYAIVRADNLRSFGKQEGAFIAANASDASVRLTDKFPADPLVADDGNEYRLIVHSGEPTVTVPKASVDTLLRESLLLRRQAGELRTIQSLLAQGGVDTQSSSEPAVQGPGGGLYSPIYDYDGLRTDPGVIHNHDFLRDSRYVAAYRRGISAIGGDQRSYWRVHVALWCAEYALRLPGDFVECGVWRGLLSSSIMEYLRWNDLDRHFYLFDTFRGIDEAQLSDAELLKGNVAHFRHHYRDDIYEDVVSNFSEFNRVTICRGIIPDTLTSVEIDRISYLSIDLNNAGPEIASANYFWNKLVPGAIIILDDYGFVSFEEQKKAWDQWSAQRGVAILALPTGQGLMIKPPTS